MKLTFDRPKYMVMILFAFVITYYNNLNAQEYLRDYESYQHEGRSIILKSNSEQKLRITPYGDYIIRVQAVKNNEEFFPDNHYEMVEAHQWDGNLILDEKENYISIKTKPQDGITLMIKKQPMRIEFYQNNEEAPLLKEENGICWNDNKTWVELKYDSSEHFTGLGHNYLGRSASIDLKDKMIERNYGKLHEQQAPLIVPFFLSSKGYGIFLNSTFDNSFNFGNNKKFEFGIDDSGFESRMDYFFILGPEFKKILNRYTQLTGRPRLPQKAVFGLALSDKANDHNSDYPSDEKWWKEKIIEHRKAGFPIDHVVNDNRWRAGGGQRCESYFDWDKERYPDPNEYAKWLSQNGLITTLDFNRCISSKSEGWEKSFNIPITDSIAFNESAPDFTNEKVRKWFWNLFWIKSLNPKLGYPGDALWIDEFDEMGKAPGNMILHNKRSWAEMRNYWFFLIAKALVQEGWDVELNKFTNEHSQQNNFLKRPFVWVRGMSAGAQRYATLWSGDILADYEDMRKQIVSLQLAGLSGFPYWGHDAGGFHGGELGKGPDDNMYRQWSMAFGSFTPFWRPHGVGQSRWPLNRSLAAQHDAKIYSELRYKLMPYTYTFAYEAYASGVPMARAMVIDYQNNLNAWKYDLQYMWGNEMLITPNASDNDNVSIWMPDGNWFDYWSGEKYFGNEIIDYPAPTGKLPIFIKEGSIIPMADYALSTFFINDKKLNIKVYSGKDASFNLYEDDGVTELYKNNQKRFTKMFYNESEKILLIKSSQGIYKNALREREYEINFFGFENKKNVKINGKKIIEFSSDVAAKKNNGIYWNDLKKILSIFIDTFPVDKDLNIQLY
ncbi:MAG: TIM-barrel domain-containing protein [Ignavibacteriaceae bacterium]